MSAPPQGTPVGLELGALDVARGVEFYTNVFGWKFSPSTHGFPAHKLMAFDVTGGIMPVGGALRLVEEIPQSAGIPKLYLYVNDMAEALEAIKKYGGKEVSKVLAEGDKGHFQYVQDSEGNPLAIYSYQKK